MATKTQKIVTKLTADSKGLNQALDTAQEKLRGTSVEAKKLKATVGKPTGVDWGAWGKAAGVGIAAVSGAVVALTQHFNALNDQAQVLGTTAEGLQRLDNAARDTGTSAEGLHSAYSRFISTLASAQKGSAKAQKALAQLGLTAKDLSEGGEKAFLKAAAALGNIGSATDRDAAAMAVFGNATAATQKALAQCVETGQSMAGIVTDAQVARFARLSKNIDSIKDSLWNMAGVLASRPVEGIADFLDLISGKNVFGDTSATNGAEIEEMDAWNAQYGADAVAARKRREAQRRRREAARQKVFDDLAEEQKLEELQRQSRQEEARQAAMNEMRRAGMTPEQREWEDYRTNRGEAIARIRRETGWDQNQAEQWARTVYDPENMPGATAGYAPQNVPRQAFPAAVAASRPGVGLDAILGAILSLRANTYIVK